MEIFEIASNILSDLKGIQVLKNLKSLVLRENNINKIDFIDGLIHLQFLDLTLNKLRSVEKSNIGILPNIKTLICDSNYLKNINAFCKLNSTTYFSFENNKISEWSNIEKLCDLENLKEINLINNPISGLYYYRTQMIKKFIFLSRLDGTEITKEEREMIMLEQMQMNEEQNNNNQMVMPIANKNDKFPMKVNFVNLDLMLGIQSLNINATKFNDKNEKEFMKNKSPKSRENLNNLNQYTQMSNNNNNNTNLPLINYNYIKINVNNTKKGKQKQILESTINTFSANNNINAERNISSNQNYNLGKYLNNVISGSNSTQNKNYGSFRIDKISSNLLPMNKIMKQIGEELNPQKEREFSQIRNLSKSIF